jgi:hypothetical protein
MAKRKKAPKQSAAPFMLMQQAPVSAQDIQNLISQYLGAAAQVGRLQFSPANTQATILWTNNMSIAGGKLSLIAANQPEFATLINGAFARGSALLSGH